MQVLSHNDHNIVSQRHTYDSCPLFAQNCKHILVLTVEGLKTLDAIVYIQNSISAHAVTTIKLYIVQCFEMKPVTIKIDTFG